MYVMRSPHAAARIVEVSVATAKSSPCVLAVLTGADATSARLNPIRSRIVRRRPDGQRHLEPPYHVLAVDRVRHVGEAVVAVVAETVEQARDAAEKIEVQYEPLPACVVTRGALAREAPLVWEDAADNLCFRHEVGDKDAVDAAFARAAHVARAEFAVSRVTASPMETRSAIGMFDPSIGRYTLISALQAVHAARAELAEFLAVPESSVRVVATDCGGSFGLKQGLFPELALVLWVAQRLGRPVRWQCERSESFGADDHARDNQSMVELALDERGRFLGLRLHTISAIGSYVGSHGLHSPVNNLGGLSGPYRIPAIHAVVSGVLTNTSPTGAYRGAGRPEASIAIEAVIDAAARKLGIDRAELRRRNMIPP